MTDTAPPEPTPAVSQNSYAFPPSSVDPDELVWSSSRHLPWNAAQAISQATRRRDHLADNR